MSMFIKVEGKTAYLVGCSTPCPVYEHDGKVYAHTGHLFRALKESDGKLLDSDGRPWIIEARGGAI